MSETELYDPRVDGTGEYCCPLCLYWYDTPEEKQRCLTETHGFETIEIGPCNPSDEQKA